MCSFYSVISNRVKLNFLCLALNLPHPPSAAAKCSLLQHALVYVSLKHFPLTSEETSCISLLKESGDITHVLAFTSL